MFLLGRERFGLIRRIHRITKKRTTSFVMSVCTSARPHGTARLPQDGFSWNLGISVFVESRMRKLKFN